MANIGNHQLCNCNKIMAIYGQPGRPGTTRHGGAWRGTTRHGGTVVPYLIVPPCQGCGPGTTLSSLNRVAPCHRARWAAMPRIAAAAHGVHKNRYTTASRPTSAQHSTAIAHPLVAAATPGLAVATPPLAVAAPWLGVAPPLQIPSLCAQSSLSRRVRRVDMAARLRASGRRG